MLADAKRSVEQVGQAYGIADTKALEFYEAVYNGKYKIKEGQTNLQAYQGYLSRLSFSFKNISSMAKNFIGNLGANVLNALGGMAVGALAGGLMTLAGRRFLVKLRKKQNKKSEKLVKKHVMQQTKLNPILNLLNQR